MFDIVTDELFDPKERKNLGRVKQMFCEIYKKITKKEEATAQVLIKAAIFCTKAKNYKSKKGWQHFVESFRNMIVDDNLNVDQENNQQEVEQVKNNIRTCFLQFGWSETRSSRMKKDHLVSPSNSLEVAAGGLGFVLLRWSAMTPHLTSHLTSHLTPHLTPSLNPG